MGHIPVADWGDGEPIPLPGNKQPNTGKPKLMEMTSEMKMHTCWTEGVLLCMSRT